MKAAFFVALVVAACAAAQSTVLFKQYADTILCAPATLQYEQTVVSSSCYYMPDSESGWPAIKWSCNATLTTQAIFSTSYEDAACQTPAATHWNYENECKANVLRVVTGSGFGQRSVKLYNCTSDDCTSCPTLLGELPVDWQARVAPSASTCMPNPAPWLITGKAVRVGGVYQRAALLHQWWSKPGCGNTTGYAYGFDLIVLGECNNGYKFDCV